MRMWFSVVFVLCLIWLSVSRRRPGFTATASIGYQRMPPLPPLKSTFIYASRNDDYNAFSSALRLKASLNALDRGLVQFGLESVSEIMVVDWASSSPLEKIPDMREGISTCVRWLFISPELLDDLNMSRTYMSEVHAYNAAARRARGELILRLDQDTILTPAFFNWFARFHSYDEDTYIMFGRRDSSLAERDRILEDAWAYVRNKSAVLSTPLWNNQFSVSGFKKGSGAIGVIIFARSLWSRLQGYNEAMVGWGHMEVELFRRAFVATNRTADLPSDVNEWYPAIHIHHDRANNNKSVNPMGLENSERKYNPAFGFAFEQLEETGWSC